ncbi:MAG: hypothetical protein C4K47_07005 [Candidatus Thorarchaeota archaeon]|nr:MAG: hypothetical protein C4K47_07005 [Candidatus Thorarchaeota archaeon]
MALAQCEGFIQARRESCAKWVRMSDDDKYRTEPSREDESEKIGLLRPLPTSDTGPTPRKTSPVVEFLGISMRENRRDLLVLFLIPLLVAITDASVYSAIAVGALAQNAAYMFGIPALVAITIGLTAYQTSRALIGAVLTALFFSAIFVIFLVSPALLSQPEEVGGFFLAGLSVITVYFLFVMFSSLLGTVIGIIIREFA